MRKGITNKIAGTNRQKKIEVCDIQLNFLLMNCQSLKLKLDSLAKNFNENKAAFIQTTEMLFKHRDPQLTSYLASMEDEFNIKCIRKDWKSGETGRAHGGVALFFDADYCSFSKLDLTALKGQAKEFEILACKGKLKGVKREIVVFTCYLPPRLTKKEITDILETLTDAVSEARAKIESPWLCIGGDFNQ